jgi:hypothetical protein
LAPGAASCGYAPFPESGAAHRKLSVNRFCSSIFSVNNISRFFLQYAETIKYTGWQSVALVGFYVFFVEKIIKNHDYPACANLRFDGSLQGKKSPCGRFLEVLHAKRNKLLGKR